MVNRALHPPAPPGTAWPHEWNRYDNYQLIHDRRFDELCDRGMILDGDLHWDALQGSEDDPQPVHLYGELACREGITIEVDKYLQSRRVRGHLEVRGRIYRYQAVQKVDGRAFDLVRYDCTPHTEDGQGRHHLDHLHRHVFDLRTGVLLRRESLTVDQLPNFHQFVEYAVSLGELRIAA